MSAEIKHVIGLLCKQINMMFNTSLKPEYLRLAKFDKNEQNVVPILWTTLNLLTIKRCTVDVQQIKNHMKSLNYNAHLFYSLPEDLSCGSRELLVAIVFVVGRSLPDLVKEEIKKSPFDESCSLLDLENIQIHRPEIPNAMTEKDMKNYLMWLKGKTQQNVRMTAEYEAQISKIYDKLNGLLNTKASSKLSMNEILALSSQKYCTEFLDKSSYIMDLLECYQEWARKQKIFWKWMSTVLIERQQDFI